MATVASSAVARPSPRLEGLVHRITGYHYEGFEPGLHVGLPGRHLTLVVSLHDPVRVDALPDPTRPGVAHGALVGGLHAGPVVIAHDGTQVGLQVDLEPLGALALLGVPASELASEVVDLPALLGPSVAAELDDRLRAAASWPARFAVLEEVLARRLDGAAPAPAPEVRRAWDRLVASHGQEPVAAVAAEVGWSRRHLAERFRREVGLTPKALARVVRFQRAADLLKADPGRSLADVAAVVGCADQPHLNREWRAMAGLSPTAWMAAERLPVLAPA